MDTLPSIVVVSSSCTKPKSIIRLITKVNPEEQNNGLFIQPWLIDTKYYTATVNIIGLNESYKRDAAFNSQVEALIIHFDTNKASGLDDLKKWDDLQSDCEPEIKLLISNYCNNETKVTKTEAMSWCLERGFEFIELYPAEQNMENTEEDIIPEKFGVNRIIEALQAHTWSNLMMKSSKKASNKKQEASNDDTIKIAKAGLTDEFVGEDDFTELFSQLHMMKDSLQSLPMNQRKQCAEQMVTAFWKAIGGDEEELLEL